MGTTIMDVKVVGECSKHGGKMVNKFGTPIRDKDICCLTCSLNSKEVKKK